MSGPAPASASATLAYSSRARGGAPVAADVEQRHLAPELVRGEGDVTAGVVTRI